MKKWSLREFNNLPKVTHLVNVKARTQVRDWHSTITTPGKGILHFKCSLRKLNSIDLFKATWRVLTWHDGPGGLLRKVVLLCGLDRHLFLLQYLVQDEYNVLCNEAEASQASAHVAGAQPSPVRAGMRSSEPIHTPGAEFVCLMWLCSYFQFTYLAPIHSQPWSPHDPLAIVLCIYLPSGSGHAVVWAKNVGFELEQYCWFSINSQETVGIS